MSETFSIPIFLPIRLRSTRFFGQNEILARVKHLTNAKSVFQLCKSIHLPKIPTATAMPRVKPTKGHFFLTLGIKIAVATGEKSLYNSIKMELKKCDTWIWSLQLPWWWGGRCWSPCPGRATPQKRAQACQRRASLCVQWPPRKWGGGRGGWQAP